MTAPFRRVLIYVFSSSGNKWISSFNWSYPQIDGWIVEFSFLVDECFDFLSLVSRSSCLSVLLLFVSHFQSFHREHSQNQPTQFTFYFIIPVRGIFRWSSGSFFVNWIPFSRSIVTHSNPRENIFYLQRWTLPSFFRSHPRTLMSYITTIGTAVLQ